MPASPESPGLVDAFAARIASRPRIPARRLALSAASLVLVVLLLWLGMPWATGSAWPEIIAALAAPPAWTLPALALLGLLAVGLEGLAVHVAVPGSRPGPTIAAQTAGGAVALAVPGGGVLGAGVLGWILHRGGLPVRRALAGVVGVSVMETVVTTVLLPIVGLAAYALASAAGAHALPGAVAAAVAAVAGGAIALALLAALLNRSVLLRVLSGAADLTGRGGLLEEGLAVRDDTVALLRARGAACGAALAAARVVQMLALALALRASGVELSALLVIAVFALGRAVSLIPLTPGGAGLTETAIAGALTALGAGASAAGAVALLMAVVTLIVPLLAGAAASAALPERRGEDHSSS